MTEIDATTKLLRECDDHLTAIDAEIDEMKKDALRLRLVAAASWPLPDVLIARLLADLAEQCGDHLDTLPTCDPETALARLLVAYLVEGELGGWGDDTEAFRVCCDALAVPFDPACEAES